jgi:hypothetical protein
MGVPDYLVQDEVQGEQLLFNYKWWKQLHDFWHDPDSSRVAGFVHGLILTLISLSVRDSHDPGQGGVARKPGGGVLSRR